MFHLNQSFLDTLEAGFCQSWNTSSSIAPKEAIRIFLNSKKIGASDGRVSLEILLNKRVEKMEKATHKWLQKRPPSYQRWRKELSRLTDGKPSAFRLIKEELQGHEKS